MLTYDCDTSPTKRTLNPLFYGFVPNKALGRAVCFLSIMSLTFAHVLLLTSACALLALTNPNWLLLFLGVDMGIFYLYKMLRHPQEVGGLPFLVSAFTSVVGSFVSVHLYSNYYDEDEKIDGETLQTTLGSLVAIWFVSAVTFASVIKREFLHTFYDMDTASTYNRKTFLYLNDKDLEKSRILTRHPDVYMAWGDELIKPWTIKNWNRWEEEKPAWFTDKWIEAVPNEYIPFEWRVKYKKTKGRVENRRRSSLQQAKAMLGEEEER
ncbi:hypothetical protein TrST_g13191 [Triparma strigata]|uniref:Uncharacterized protein n=1 Tax=Triparma strigata TaxID=1606541 RepID=A0A9W7BT47_9STRA|nr:hypothetical protein TrST_g13191 [Triparma strigata]